MLLHLIASLSFFQQQDTTIQQWYVPTRLMNGKDGKRQISLVKAVFN